MKVHSARKKQTEIEKRKWYYRPWIHSRFAFWCFDASANLWITHRRTPSVHYAPILFAHSHHSAESSFESQHEWSFIRHHRSFSQSEAHGIFLLAFVLLLIAITIYLNHKYNDTQLPILKYAFLCILWTGCKHFVLNAPNSISLSSSYITNIVKIDGSVWIQIIITNTKKIEICLILSKANISLNFFAIIHGICKYANSKRYYGVFQS